MTERIIGDVGTRSEHLDWCKKRALEYVDHGALQNAFASFASDMGKHSGTAEHAALTLGKMLMVGGQLETADQMRRFIEGCN